MKVSNLLKVSSFKKIIFLNLIIFISIYLLDFVFLFPEVVRCVNLGEINFLVKSYSFPIHCDEVHYFKGTQDLDSFFKHGYPYQKRPLWIFTLKTFSVMIDFFTNNKLLPITVFRLSTICVQFVITNLLSLQIIKFLKLEDNKKFYFLISLLFIPSVRWNLFVPSNENLTLLGLFLVLNHIKFNKDSNTKSIYYLLSFLALFHRSFIFYGMFLIILNIIKQKKFLSKIFNLFHLSFFTVMYEIFIILSPYKSYDYNKEVYFQFYWFLYKLFDIPKSISFKMNNNDEICQTVTTFLNCYLNNTIEFFILYGPFVLILIVLYLRFRSIIELKNLQNLFFITLFIYTIWSFQGWYPPFRFINYSFGYFIMISIFYFINSINQKNWMIFFSLFLTQFSYNFMGLYSGSYIPLNVFTLFSFLLLIIFISSTKIKKEKNFNN